MLLINLIFEFCVVIVQAGCTPRALLPSDLVTSPLVCNLYLTLTIIHNPIVLVILRIGLVVCVILVSIDLIPISPLLLISLKQPT